MADTKQRVISSRPPIVVILGHVDHGKTTILDKIRQTKVAQGEAGGITQHIGAYQIEVESRGRITFLDTPGHEAFTAIRSRGAKIADIAVLVVAADEGVKPQTKEAIRIIRETELPFVVAINKIDKEVANPAKIRQELAENEVLVEDYGGSVPIVELSAKNSQGITELIEMISLVAELEELRAPIDGPATGIVVESHLDNKRGLVATLIVLSGSLRMGDWIAAGSAVGRIKTMEDFLGKPINTAAPSEPCLTLGWETAPQLGQTFEVFADRKEAQKASLENTSLGPANIFVKSTGASDTPGKKTANLIIKADVQSSLEAIDNALKTIHSEEVDYGVVDFGIGKITDNDVKKAIATGSAVIGFHVPADQSASKLAEREGVQIHTFDIIYGLVETVRSVLSDLLEPEIKRIDLGKLKILATFKKSGKSQIIGGRVTQGKALRGAIVDIIRNGTVITTGRLGQLQHDKADVAEVSEGLEAGLRLDTDAIPTLQTQVREGDVLEIYQEEKIKRSI